MVSVAGHNFYECWVNDVLLPAYWRRAPSAEETCPTYILAVALRYIDGRDPTP
jgi:hypothetical protein